MGFIDYLQFYILHFCGSKSNLNTIWMVRFDWYADFAKIRTILLGHHFLKTFLSSTFFFFGIYFLFYIRINKCSFGKDGMRRKLGDVTRHPPRKSIKDEYIFVFTKTWITWKILELFFWLKHFNTQKSNQ